MLCQLPDTGKTNDQPTSPDGDAFQVGLRRDLASAPVVLYEPVLGGWRKRAFDLVLTSVAAPIWLPLIALSALWAKAQRRVLGFGAEPRVGYGGRVFAMYGMRLARPTAKIEALRAGHYAPPVPRTPPWLRPLEQLPRLINVIKGEMSLVGPTPLSQEQLQSGAGSRRYYLSARPGVVGVGALAAAGDGEGAANKAYALSWSLAADVLILWEALRDRG
jgi:lipopolysaccharide/colanic/teichoic acid biosynthesis glycosyltransferase